MSRGEYLPTKTKKALAQKIEPMPILYPSAFFGDFPIPEKIGSACGGCKERALEKIHELEHLYAE